MNVRRTAAAASHATTSPSTWAGVWLVAEREVGSKLRSKAFIVSTVLLFVFALGAIIWSGIAAGSQSPTPVAVTSQTSSAVEAVTGLRPVPAGTPDEAVQMVRDGRADAALIPNATGAGAYDFTVVAKDSPPAAVVEALTQRPQVQLLDPSPTDSALRYIVALGFGLVFLMAATTFGSTIAQSVVEEKQTRVVEILLSAISTRALLAGKIIGNTVLAMGQIIGFAAIAIIGLTVTGQSVALQGLGAPLVWFAVFFFFGFVLLASLFAAAGAMVSRQEDIGSTISPLTILVMVPYFLVIFFNDNPTVLTVMSYVPFSAPVGMPLRLYLGEAQWWEPLLSLVILLAACVGAVLLAARIYRNSILRMGARVKLTEALTA